MKNLSKLWWIVYGPNIYIYNYILPYSIHVSKIDKLYKSLGYLNSFEILPFTWWANPIQFATGIPIFLGKFETHSTNSYSCFKLSGL